MFTVYFLAVYIKKQSGSLVKIKIQSQEEVGTGPSSEDINHILFSPHYGSFPTEIRGFPVKALAE